MAYACKIDALSEVDRKKVLDALLSGATIASVAALVGCSRQAVHRYKNRVLKPAISTANKLRNLDQVRGDSTALTQPHNQTVKDVISSKPALQWLSRLTERMDNGLTRAEEAVQVVRGGDGEMVPIADDLAILPSFYTAHLKGIELLGKMSGELQDKTAAPSVAIQIVIPERSAAKLDDSNAIEVGGIRIGLKR